MTKIACFVLLVALAACNSGSGDRTNAKPFCTDTSCIKDPLKFESKEAGNPFVNITFKDCRFDTIHWEKGGMGLIKDRSFQDFFAEDVKPSKQFIACDMVGAKLAWLKFNDCTTGRGYLIKLAFDKSVNEMKINTALNNFDPKYKVEDGLVAYYDNTFIYVCDINTDKVAQQLLTDKGVKKFDASNPHTLVDTLHVSKTNLYAKIYDDNGKQVEHNVPLVFK